MYPAVVGEEEEEEEEEETKMEQGGFSTVRV